jgi:hypothetical protein
VKKIRLAGQDRIKAGSTDIGRQRFCNRCTFGVGGELSQRYRLKTSGSDFEKVAERVSSLFGLERDYITGRGR